MLEYSPTVSTPFAVLTAVVAPAILTNASSVLALGTSNRLARVVDRTRVVTAELGEFEAGTADYQSWGDATSAPASARGFAGQGAAALLRVSWSICGVGAGFRGRLHCGLLWAAPSF